MPARKTPKRPHKTRGYSGGFCSTPAQREAQRRIEEDEDRSNRTLSNAFKFWRVCAIARCRRMHACAGSPGCFSEKWRHVHPDDKFLVREASLARAQGADPQRASEIAQAKLAERDALWAKCDAVHVGRAARQPDRAAPPPEPRIRRV
jgi:hypothetical protein